MPIPISKPHILVADDDETLLELLQVLLAGQGYSVVVAKDSAEFDIALKLRLPDLIVLDIMIPGSGGFDLLRAIKGDHKFRDIPVVMLSARSRERDQVQAFDFGAADFIAKPFRVEELGVRIKRVLARRRATLSDRRE